MSWLFSRALVAASSAGICSVGEPSAPLSVMPTPHKFWRNDRTMEPSDLSRFGLTCAVLTDDRGEELLTSFLAGFPAKTFPWRGGALDSRATDLGYGENLRGSFAKWDRSSSTWKTVQLSLLEDSATFSETWPRSGMTRNGRACLRPTAMPRIYGNGSGYWPTPVASDTGTRTKPYAQGGTALSLAVTIWPTPTVCGNYNRKGASSTSGDGLATAVMTWPTPTATLATKGGRVTPRKGREGGTLIEAVSARKWPTPCASASASKGSSPASLTRKSGKSRTNDRIDHAVMHSDGGQLNPEWVEWLMGWPIGHTGLEPLATAKLAEWQQQHSLNSHPDLIEAA